MTNCGLNEEKEFFVNNYEIKDDHIVVHYANGKEDVQKKTKKNVEKLTAKMNSQILGLKDYCKAHKNSMIFEIVVFVILSIIGLSVIAFLAINNVMLALLSAAGTGIFGFSGIKEMIRDKMEYDELVSEKEKFQAYLENQRTLESYIRPEHIINSTSISQQQINSRSLEGNVNPNLVDIMNLKELKELVLESKKLENLSYERFDSGEQGKQRTMGTMPGSDVES